MEVDGSHTVWDFCCLVTTLLNRPQLFELTSSGSSSLYAAKIQVPTEQETSKGGRSGVGKTQLIFGWWEPNASGARNLHVSRSLLRTRGGRVRHTDGSFLSPLRVTWVQETIKWFSLLISILTVPPTHTPRAITPLSIATGLSSRFRKSAAPRPAC